MHSLRRTLIWSSIFSVAMGYLEAAVVIYLRRLYYPDGFAFPLVPITPDIGMIEFLREAATIIMLLGIAVVAGRNMAQRFALFIFCFAVWDVFYYVFLKVFDGWPASLLTWDILFIIPVPWVGPVLAPCIVSLTMIVLTLVIIFAAEKNQHVRIGWLSWVLIIIGALDIVLSFTIDYYSYVTANGHSVWKPTDDVGLFYDIAHYTPQSFDWRIFLMGELLILGAIVNIFIQIRKDHPSKAGNRVTATSPA